MPSISNKQEVQVISLGEVTNYLTTIVVVHLPVSTATICKIANLVLYLICFCFLPEFIRSRPVKVRDHIKDPRVIADNVKVSIIDEGLVVFKAEFNVFHPVIHKDIYQRIIHIIIIRKV